MEVVFKNNLLKPVTDNITRNHKVELHVLRLDLLHRLLPGNKWFKLKYNIAAMKEQGMNKMITYGGAYSNHIAATAAAGKLVGFETTGIIRGEKPEFLSNVLKFSEKMGMKMIFISRSEYREKESESFRSKFSAILENSFEVPEGGANQLGVQGSKEILSFVEQDYSHIACSCGTGTTLAGIISGIDPKHKALITGYAAHTAVADLEDRIVSLISKSEITPNQALPDWKICGDYHFRGFAKSDSMLEKFMNRFSILHQIPLEHVYTGKLFYGIYDQLKAGIFQAGSKILAIHTGGFRL
jgi:1-aminocyclopropane-1-carboxylate deaminase